MPKLYMVGEEENGEYSFYCPGCKCHHNVWTKISKRNSKCTWAFNGDMDKPTFSPSLLVRWVDLPVNLEKGKDGKYVLGEDGRVKGAKDIVCHSFIKEGMIQYLSDCTHDLRGKTIEIPNL